MRRAKTGHEDVVVDPVEELLQIEVDHDPVTRGNVLPRLGQSAVGTPPRAEAEARRRERRVEDRLQDTQHGLLDQAIDHRRDAQLPHPAARLGDLHPLDRSWPIAASHQLRHQHVLVIGEPGPKVVDGHPVHSRRPLVRLHTLVGMAQVGRARHPFHQVLRQGSLLAQHRERLWLRERPQRRFRRRQARRGAGPSAAPRRRGQADKPCLAAAPRSSSWTRLLLASGFGPSSAYLADYYGLC